jgi:hypothetical protein
MSKLPLTLLAIPLACAGAVAACGGTDSTLFPGDGQGGPLGGPMASPTPGGMPTSTGTGTGTGMMPPPGSPPPSPNPNPPPSHDGGAPSGDASSPPAQGDASAPPPPCYSEPYSPNVDLSDLKNAYTPDTSVQSSLTAMQRRYPTGYFILDAQQNDSQLGNFMDTSSWDSLMQSMMMTMNAETGIYDFGHSQSTHTYVLRSDMVLTLTPVTTWARGEILQMLTDSSTQTYDQSELQGSAGQDDFVTLADDATAFTNGLGSITAVGNQVTSGISARDGVAANTYYLELYLRDGRTNHATDYAALKASADWQKLVRYMWARAFFWDGQAKPNPNLDIASTPIWAHVNDPTNLAEIKLFTGDDAAYVACHP